MPTPPIDLAALPPEPGVYRFRDAQGRALYIGRAIDLRRRVRSYWGSQRGRPRMRRMVPQIVGVEVAVCASEHEAAWLERNLLERSKPRWNRARGGLEVPVYLRLDGSPRSPSLTVVHDAVDAHTHFGPYLGGTRVRVAATALGSLYPLAYTGEGVRGAELAMAQARGVTPDDRLTIVDALSELLARDAAAIDVARASLEERRDAASAGLEFELAGRFQEQIEALHWLVSTQRVTEHRAVKATVAGWADGVLVEFGITDGRIRTWSQKPCAEADAEARVAATPAGWTDFALRNAELAAQVHALHA